MLEDCGPAWGDPLQPDPPGGATWQPGPADLVTVPAPGRQAQGRARFKGPPMLPSPHQITSAITATLAQISPENGTENRKNGPKNPKKTGVQDQSLEKRHLKPPL